MSEDFDPMNKEREPRSKGFKEETQKICKLIKNRGDQRIGQQIINAIYHSEKLENIKEHNQGLSHKEEVEIALWELEAPQLLEALQKLDKKTGDSE
jgi:hypothetical protein